MAALMVSGAVRFKIHRVPTEKLGRRVLEKDDEDEEEEEDEYMYTGGREKGLGIKIREGRPQMYTHGITSSRTRILMSRNIILFQTLLLCLPA